MPTRPQATVADVVTIRAAGEARRRQILGAAEAEFAEKGFEGGSMRLIARNVGLELAHIQYYFGNKASLWDAVVSNMFGRYCRTFDEVLAQNADRPPDEVIALIIASIVHFAAGNPHFVSLMARTRQTTSIESQSYRRQFDEGLDAFLVLIGRAQAEGRFVSGDPVILFAQLMGAALRIFTATDLEVRLGRSPLDPAVIDEHIQTCTRLFMPGRQAPV